MNQTITVGGMTCENCVRHVRDALRGLPGVEDVKVDLASGQAVIETPTALDRPMLASALEEAGYELL